MVQLTARDLSYNQFYFLGMPFFDFVPPNNNGWVQALCNESESSFKKGRPNTCPKNTALFTMYAKFLFPCPIMVSLFSIKPQI